MQSKQLQYALAIARTRSFSQAAEEMNISQPALSKQIISLENDLGIKLFDRSVTPIALTPAGDYFLSRARKLLFEEENLLKTMEQFKTGENGRLVIGISPFRSLYMMPGIIKALKQRFPGLQVVLSEQGSAQLHKGVLDGSFDFAIMNLPVDESQLDVILLEKDSLVLAVPKAMEKEIVRRGKGNAVSMAECASLPFVTLSPGQEMRILFDKLCALSDITPQVAVEVVGIATAWAMVQAGVGAAILPRQFLDGMESNHVLLLPLNQNTYVRQPAIVTRHQQYISPYAQFAVELITKHEK